MAEELDFSSYIDSRLLEIEDLEKRDFAKHVLKDVFLELLHYSEESQRNIERRMQKSFEVQQNYPIVLGVVSREEYDVTNSWIYPMVSEDICEKEINLEQMKDKLKKGESYEVCTVFFHTSYDVIRRLREKQYRFDCQIKTSNWTYHGKCYIQPRTDYEEKLVDLYKVFCRNGVKYPGPNIAYLKRFFKVYLEAADFYDIDEIIEIEIDFGEYKSYVKYNIFPVWNIETRTVSADVKPQPCRDVRQYIHVINGNRLQKDCNYLVANAEYEIYEVYKDDDLSIITSADKKMQWELYVFHLKREGVFTYEFFSNGEGAKGERVRSKADIFRFVKKQNYEEYVVLKQIEICDKKEYRKQTYDMNDYLPDYLAPNDRGKQLCLYFENRVGDYSLLTDIMSYIVTALQEECPEYDCIGILL